MNYISLPLPPAELRGNSRAYRLVKHAKAKCYRLATKSQLQGFEKKKFVGYTVFFTFPNKARRDCDNFAIGLKSAFDEVAKHIEQDDSEWQSYGTFKEVCKFRVGVIIVFHEVAPFDKNTLKP